MGSFPGQYSQTRAQQSRPKEQMSVLVSVFVLLGRPRKRAYGLTGAQVLGQRNNVAIAPAFGNRLVSSA